MNNEGERLATSAALWHKCDRCKEIIYREDFESNLNVCPLCSHHAPLSANRRLTLFLDTDSFSEHDANLHSTDPLQFADRKSYAQRLTDLHDKTQHRDAIVSGQGTLNGMPVAIAAFDFAFLGGSMGAVVGEKITRLFDRARTRCQPAIIFSASGGARMQEGLVSLLQMAKTCTALANLQQASIPFISILTNPTTGGVAASFAMLGDVNIAEPNALIGFAGPRVISQTIHEKLPAGFQRSEYLLEHGMLDMICPRAQLRATVSNILSILWQQPQTNIA